jgi:hypothetical protein
MKLPLMTSLCLTLLMTASAWGQHHISTREVEGPLAPFAKQLNAAPFRAIPLTSPSDFLLRGEGNFQAQPLNKAEYGYMPSFRTFDPSFRTMEHEGVGGLTETGPGREMGRSWNDLFSPFNTGRQTWEPTKFIPPALPEDRPHEQMWIPKIGSIGQRVPNGPSWINIDFSKDPIEPLQGFQTPIPQSLDTTQPR